MDASRNVGARFEVANYANTFIPTNLEVADGVRQLITNQEEIFNKAFFSTVQLVLAGSDSQGLRYGTTGTPEQFFVEWKDEAGDVPFPSFLV